MRWRLTKMYERGKRIAPTRNNLGTGQHDYDDVIGLLNLKNSMNTTKY